MIRIPLSNYARVPGAVREFQDGACVFYLTPSNTLAVLRRHYQYEGWRDRRFGEVRLGKLGGGYPSIFGFDYPLGRPTRPVFVNYTAAGAIQAAIDAGREVVVAPSLACVIHHLTGTPNTLDAQQLATLRAALDYYRMAGQGDPAERSDHTHDLATNYDQEISLNADGIEELFEQVSKWKTS
jgi:hypothetical protein